MASGLDLVDVLLALVVAAAGVALAVLVLQDGAGGFQDGRGDIVLAGDQAQGLGLELFLGADEGRQFGVGGGEGGVRQGKSHGVLRGDRCSVVVPGCGSGPLPGRPAGAGSTHGTCPGVPRRAAPRVIFRARFPRGHFPVRQSPCVLSSLAVTPHSKVSSSTMRATIETGAPPRPTPDALSLLNGDPVSTSESAIASAEAHSAHNYHPLPVVVASAEGAWMTDVEGRRYLDMLAGYSALNFGHGNRRLIDAAKAQLERVTLTSRAFHHDRFADFCTQLAELCGMEMVLPMNTGAEAVETAVKTARKWGYRVKGVPDGHGEDRRRGQQLPRPYDDDHQLLHGPRGARRTSARTPRASRSFRTGT